MTKRADLPRDAASILKLAARSMFDLFANAAQGMMLVDRAGHVVWINDAYKRFLPALGFEREEDFVGRPVERVVPNTLMHKVIETGKPILVDLLTNKAGTFVVSRIPLRDERGAVIGALGMVLFDHPETTLQPLIGKFARLQRDLDAARRELAARRRPKYTFASFIGASPATVEVKRQARRAAATDSTVLLLGETGTGKELLAHAIHAASMRADKPFIGINLAAVPETLIEAEFFGVAPGAFTGAERRQRDGKFALADGGTLFLDEIGDMPLALQAKLLRALQEQEIEPLGSNEVRRIDVRVIAATSRNLQALVDAGTFRADLFYRLNVLPIRVPALRERLSDLDALCESLLEQIAARSGMPQRELTPAAIQRLAAHPWPGNVRELRNALEQAAMLTDDIRLDADDFERVLRTVSPSPAPRSAESGPREERPQTRSDVRVPAGDAGAAAGEQPPLAQRIAELERESIRAALAATGGNKVSAAKLLGISRATLYEKLAAMKGDAA